jgi:hypothetical protein
VTDPNPNGAASPVIVEPPLALVTGAVLGGCAFLLSALLFGVPVAVCIAALFVVGALLRRALAAALFFALCGALAAGGLAWSTTALILSSAAFGVALAAFAHDNAREA